ncbi:MAG: hypothetical protein ACKO2G_02250 [Verrucomicrobiales bacterium]
MPWEQYQALPPAPPPELSWQHWAGAGVALVILLITAVVLSRRFLRKRPLPLPPPLPSNRALNALSAIPADWPVDRSAAAGARVLRAYLGAVGMGPGLAHPARSFSGLRAAEAWRELTNLLVEMESLSCRLHPTRADWDDARALAETFLKTTGQTSTQGGAP